MQIKDSIFIILLLITSSLFAQNERQIPPIDQNLLGIWEVQLNSTEYMRITMDSIDLAYGPGSFMKFTKNASGGIDQILYDSGKYSIPRGGLTPAISIGWSDLSITAGQGRTSYGRFRDFGVSRGDPYDRKLHDTRDVELRLYRDCRTCVLKMDFKITSLKLFASQLETLVPLQMTLTKI